MLTVNKKYLICLIVVSAFYYLVGQDYVNYLFYITVSLFITALVYIIIVRNGICSSISANKHRFNTNETVNIITEIKNKTILPVPLSIMNISLTNEESISKAQKTMSLKPMTKINIISEFKLTKRGIYSVVKTSFITNDIFYIFKTKFNFASDLKIKVYPSLYNIKIDALEIGGVGTYAHNTNEINDFSTIKDIRKYNIGDNFNKIHWKVSAKYGELYTKNYESNEKAAVNLIIDMNKSAYSNLEEEEKLISSAASIVKALISKDIAVNIYVNNKEMYLKRVENEKDFNLLLEYFVMNKSIGEKSISEFINENLKKIALIKQLICVTPKADDRLEKLLNNLKFSGFNCKLFKTESFKISR